MDAWRAVQLDHEIRQILNTWQRFRRTREHDGSHAILRGHGAGGKKVASTAYGAGRHTRFRQLEIEPVAARNILKTVNAAVVRAGRK